MKKSPLLIGLFFVIVSPCFALDLIGPGIAPVEGTNYLGVEYVNSEQELKAKFYDWADIGFRLDIEKVGGYFRHDFTNNIAGFLRAGGARGNIGSVKTQDKSLRFLDGGDYSPYFGAGLSVFKRDGKFLYSLTGQFTYNNIDLATQKFQYGRSWHRANADVSGDMDLYEAQIIGLLTFQVTERLSIFGGPMLVFTDGTVETEADFVHHRGWWSWSEKEEFDITPQSNFGGVIGLAWSVNENATLSVDYQQLLPGGSYGVNCGLICKY